jgi:antibiotic biosynthesis monooxygenase (ABM) superfamily enzyme
MAQHPDIDKPPRARRWRAQATMTLAAWLIAFLVVMALTMLFNEQLASLSLPLRALVLSGVLVALMVNLVMPLISAVVARRFAPRPARRVSRECPQVELPETSSGDNALAIDPGQ